MTITASYIAHSILYIAIIAGIGFILRKKGVLSPKRDTLLVNMLVYVAFPALTFTTILKQFTMQSLPLLGILFSASIGIFALGMLIAAIYLLFLKRFVYAREVMGLLSLHNCAYLPMNIALFIRDETTRGNYLLYIFLYTAGFNLLMWSIGSYMIFKKEKEHFKIQTLLTPPVTSVILALLVALAGFQHKIPAKIIWPLEKIGGTSFFLSLITLGSALATVNTSLLRQSRVKSSLVHISILKLFIIPLLIHVFNCLTHTLNSLGFFILLQAAMPSAVSLTVVGSYRKADISYLSVGIFLTTVFSLATIPAWLFVSRYYW